MPLYTISTQKGVLSPAEKVMLAKDVTDFHCETTGLDRAYVKIVFDTFSAGEGFVGGEPAAAAILTVLIRGGRSVEYKAAMLQKLWAMLQRATRATDTEILVAIQEAPASNAMELGVIMPDLDAAAARSS